MKPWERKIAPLGFLFAGVLFVIAAVVPALKGRSFNATFLGVGAVFFVLGVVTLRKSSVPGPPSS
mgnify:CR=1 FL=1